MVAMSLAIPVLVNVVSIGAAAGILALYGPKKEPIGMNDTVWMTFGLLCVLGAPWAGYLLYNSRLLQLLMYEFDGVQRNSLVNVIKYAVMEVTKNADKVLTDVGESVASNIRTIATGLVQ